MPVDTQVKPAPASETDNRIQSGAVVLATCVQARRVFKSARNQLYKTMMTDPAGARRAFEDLFILCERGVANSASVCDPNDPTRTVPPSRFIDGALNAGRGSAKSAVQLADSFMDSASGVSRDAE